MLTARAAKNGWRPPEDGGLEILERAGLTDICAHASRTLRTAPAPCPLYRIDHALASSLFSASWDVSCAAVAKSITCSDHLPLVVDVRRRPIHPPSSL